LPFLTMNARGVSFLGTRRLAIDPQIRRSATEWYHRFS
jgi:hypothetical protein